MFYMRWYIGGLAFDEDLCHGDLLFFPRMWEHEVLAPTKLQLSTQQLRSDGTSMIRVNFTFRRV
jgi:hypothetical protein